MDLTQILETTASSVVGLGAILLIVFLMRKKNGASPKRDKDDYYVVHRVMGDWKICNAFTEFTENVTDRYYLRKVPFDLEILAENVTAMDGNTYNAIATVKVYLSEDKATAVAHRYFDKNYRHYADEAIDADLSELIGDGLESALRTYDGGDKEALKGVFKAEAMMRALTGNHTLVSVSDFSVVKQERTAEL